MLFTAINLVLMVVIKMRWTDYESESNDFMMRFFYTHIFITSNLFSLFFGEDQASSKSDRKYIPYEDYTMEEEPEFEEH